MAWTKKGKGSCSLLQAEQHMLDFLEDPFFIHSHHALVVTYMHAQLLASLALDISNDWGVKRLERA